MKIVTILFLFLLICPASGQLTKDDLRAIIKEEVRPIIKEEITASEKRLKEYVDLKIETVNARINGLEQSLNARIDETNTRIDGLDQKIDDVEKNLNVRIDGIDKKFDRVWLVILGLIGLITAAIAVPQIIIASKEKGREEMQQQIDQLREQLQVLQNPPPNPTA